MAAIVQWNIRGARANQAWLRHKIFSSAQIVALQETFLSENTLFSMPGKVVYRLDRPSSFGGGLVTAVSNQLSSAKINIPLTFPSVELLGVEIFLPNRQTLTVINIYVPQGHIEGNWLQHVLSLCKSPFFVVGDFNAHHVMWGAPRNTPGGSCLAEWVAENNISILNTKFPTRVGPGGTMSLLDLSLSSPDMFDSTTVSVYPDPFDSDHLPILINWQYKSNGGRGVVRCRYDWARLSSTLNGNINRMSDVNYGNFNECCIQSLKISKRQYWVNMRTGAPWWDSRLSYLLGQKRKLLRKTKKELSAALWIEYKQASATLRREIHEARRAYWSKTCKDSARSGKIFKILKKLQDRQVPPPNSHNVIQGPHGTKLDIVEEANAFGEKYHRPAGMKIPLDFSVNFDSRIRQTLELRELEEALKKGAIKTPGKDEISLKLLRNLDQGGKEILLKIFNDIWMNVDIPLQWQETIIVPILKPGRDAKRPENYRPISLTSTVSKVFERILMNRITRWLLTKKVFHQNHYGFLPFRDSSSALAKLYNDLAIARKSRKHVILLTLDITEAYDSVVHDFMALKLLMAGLDGHLVYWLYEFTSNNRYQVRWKRSMSDVFHQEIGVPQGRVLSPYLFSFYMKDFFETLELGVEALVYADDVFIYSTGETFEEACKSIQKTVENATKWGKYWKLKFNPTKSSLLNVSNKRGKPESPIYLDGHLIPWVKSVKILGLWFNASLTWNQHFTELKKKTLRKINVFKSIASPRRGIGTRDLLQIAYSGVISLLHYGSHLHSLACKSARDSLEPLQNTALRVAIGLPKWTPIPILRRVAKATSLYDSHNLYRKLFLLRHLALGENSPIASMLQGQIQDRSIFSSQVADLLDEIKVNASHILTGSAVVEVPHTVCIQYETSDYPFQNKKLHPLLINSLFRESMELWNGWHIMASDASKTQTQTTIGCWDQTREEGKSYKVNCLNSIFTAEALALRKALSLSPQVGKLLLLSDSLAVIKALQNVHQGSPKVVITIHSELVQAGENLEEIRIVWVPGHCGILCNEKADALARVCNPCSGVIPDISPEDIVKHLRRRQHEENAGIWLTSKYINKFPHLVKCSWEHRKLRLSRYSEVQLVRLQTQTLPTKALLYKLGLSASPLCPVCNVPETTEHFLMECRRFRPGRTKLYRRLGVTALSATFCSLCDLAVSGSLTSRALVSFLLESARF